MSELVFEAFPKIGRLRRECTITEKIDGTNAQICFDADGELLVGSRKREIFPEGTYYGSAEDFRAGKPKKGTDNFGFARWAWDNREALFEFLGEGRHFGEWYGAGIQCGYDLDEKRFALFNTARFGPGRQEVPKHLREVGLDVVPVLYQGEFHSNAVNDCMHELAENGSRISGGTAEGVVVYHHALRQYSKVTFDYDDGKWRHQ